MRQKGVVQILPLLVVLAVVGVVSFLLLTSLAPFNNPQSQALFPKSLPKAATPQSFGVNDHLMWQGINSTQADLDRMKQDGILTVRFDLDWVNLEPTQKGSYDANYLQRLDDTLSAISSRGMQPIVTFLQSPSWALGPSCRDIPSGMCPPTNPQDYSDTLAFLAKRYVTSNPNLIWEIWNEPNQPDYFWKTTTGLDPKLYTQLLQTSFKAVKQVAPSQKVLGGVIAFNDTNFLKGMYSAGAKGYFDGLDIHPYAKTHAPSDTSEPFYSFKGAIEDLENVMVQNGEIGKPIYITEMGWDNSLDPTTRANYYQQAVQLVKTYPFVISLNPFTFKSFTGDDSTTSNALVVNGVATAAWTSYTTEIPKAGTSNIQAGVNLLQNPSFESGAPGFSPWSFVTTGGTAATLAQDTNSATSGNSSATVTITTPAPSQSQNWYIQLRQIGQAITQDLPYTVTFDAKAQNSETITVAVQQAITPYTVHFVQNVNLTPNWSRYSYSFNSPSTDGLVMLEFNLGGSIDKVWLDNVQFCTPTACANSPLPLPTSTSAPTAVPTPTLNPTTPPTPDPTVVPTIPPTPVPTVTSLILTFDTNLTGLILNTNLNRVYPQGVIDWGINTWFLSAPWGGFRTNSISFNRPGLNSGSFNFVTPRVLMGLKAFNGGTGSSVITLSCPGNPISTFTVAPSSLSNPTLPVSFNTGWNVPCSTVTVTSTNGWWTNFDDLIIR